MSTKSKSHGRPSRTEWEALAPAPASARGHHGGDPHPWPVGLRMTTSRRRRASANRSSTPNSGTRRASPTHSPLSHAQHVERTWIDELAGRRPLDTAMAVRLGANALIGLVVANKPEIYGFIVRSMRTSNGGSWTIRWCARCTNGWRSPHLPPTRHKPTRRWCRSSPMACSVSSSPWSSRGSRSHEPLQEEVVGMIVRLVQQGFAVISGQAEPDGFPERREERPA